MSNFSGHNIFFSNFERAAAPRLIRVWYLCGACIYVVHRKTKVYRQQAILVPRVLLTRGQRSATARRKGSGYENDSKFKSAVSFREKSLGTRLKQTTFSVITMGNTRTLAYLPLSSIIRLLCEKHRESLKPTMKNKFEKLLSIRCSILALN